MRTVLHTLIAFGLLLELTWIVTIAWLSYDLLWGALAQ
jgi:hypothetical protein